MCTIRRAFVQYVRGPPFAEDLRGVGMAPVVDVVDTVVAGCVRIVTHTRTHLILSFYTLHFIKAYSVHQHVV